MQTRYDSSSTPSEVQRSHLTPVKSVATSELPPAVKIASQLGLGLILLGTFFGSLLASPYPYEDDTTTTTQRTQTTSPATTTETPVTSAPPTATTPPVETDPTAPTATTPPVETDPTAPTATTPPVETAPTDPTAPTATTPPVETAPTDPTAPTPSSPSGLPPITPPVGISPNVETTQPSATPTDPTAIPPSQPDTMSGVGEAGAGETAASTPNMETGGTSTAAAPSSVDKTQLSQTLYNKIDSAWTQPVDGDSAYTVKLNNDGEIIGFEPKTEVAQNNVNNTPLPNLVNAQAASSDAAAEFEVVFSTSGILDVKSPQ